MSKIRLQQVLNEIQENVINRDQALRKEKSNKQSHLMIFDAADVYREVEKELIVRGITPEPAQKAKLDSLIRSTLSEIYSTFSLKARVASAKVTGTPNRFTIRVSKVGGSPRIFDDHLRPALKKYIGKLETQLSELFGGDKTWSRDNKSRQDNFFNLGHLQGSAIADQGASLFITPEQKDFLRSINSEQFQIEIEKFGLYDPQRRLVGVKLQGSKVNQNTSETEEKGKLVALSNKITKYLLTQIDLPNLKGSPSITEEAIESIIDAANNKKAKRRSSSSKAKKKITTKTTESTSKFKLGVGGNIETRNWSSLIQIINARLPQEVMSNMGSPKLNNRTGTFAKSTRVVDVRITPEGHPSFGLTYDKTPYGVFDRTNGAAPWNTPERDPHSLIQESFSNIIKDMAIGRFYMRRL